MPGHKLYHLFVAGRYDPEKNLIRSAACLADPAGRIAGRLACTQDGHRQGTPWNQACGEHAAGLAAFELGCCMAAMNGAVRILLHAPEQVDHDVMFRVREDKSVRTDADGGMDYFGTGVFVYRPGEGAPMSAWQEAISADTRAMCCCGMP